MIYTTARWANNRLWRGQNARDLSAELSFIGKVLQRLSHHLLVTRRAAPHGSVLGLRVYGPWRMSVEPWVGCLIPPVTRVCQEGFIGAPCPESALSKGGRQQGSFLAMPTDPLRMAAER